MSILAARLDSAEVGLSEPIRCMKIVASLPPSWLQNAEYLNTHRSMWSVTWLKEKILEQEYFRLSAAAGQQKGSRTSASQGDEETGVAAAVTKGKGKGKQKQQGDGQNQAGTKNKSLPFVRYDNGGCWYCKKAGHTWKECRSKPENWKPGMKSLGGGGGAAATQVQEEKGWAFTIGQQVEENGATVAAAQQPLHPLTHWALDSGASWSMTPDLSLLTNLQPPPFQQVSGATGVSAPVTAMGTARVRGTGGCEITISQVLHVPDLKANLISLRSLEEKGVCFFSSNEEHKATMHGQEVWCLHADKDLHRRMWQLPVHPWPTRAATAPAPALITGQPTLEELQEKEAPQHGGASLYKWHQRLGHVSQTRIKELVQSGQVEGLRVEGSMQENSCTACMESKFSRFPFTSTSSKNRQPPGVGPCGPGGANADSRQGRPGVLHDPGG
jgi:hypothetical protein